MSKAVPYDRVSAPDFYRQLDWIASSWDDRDEYMMTQRLDRLRDLYAKLPDRYYQRALPLLSDLGWCRVIQNRPWRSILLCLRGIASDWNRDREPRQG